MTVLRPMVMCLIVAGSSSATAMHELRPRSLLFIGNSLIYTNDLPSILSSVANAAADSVRVAMVAGPNLALIDHTNGATDAIAQIDRRGWTFVLLQQGPTPAGVCRDTLIIAAMRLAPHVRAAGAQAALVLPWTRQGCPKALEFASQSAERAARAVGGIVVPVGIAWRSALDADRGTQLYGGDGYHPAPTGSLLAALTIYDRLFGRDVRSIPPESLLRLLPGAAPADFLVPPLVQAVQATAHHGDMEHTETARNVKPAQYSCLRRALLQLSPNPSSPLTPRAGARVRCWAYFGAPQNPGGHVLRGLRVVVPALLLIASACAHSGGGEEVQPTGSPAYVEVANLHALPMEVSVLGSGSSHRMGTVYPGMSSHLVVPPNLFGNGSVRFEARPSGGGQPFRSGELLLAPGVTVDFVIAAQLFNSTVTRRP
jgi:hypothetical protein